MDNKRRGWNIDVFSLLIIHFGHGGQMIRKMDMNRKKRGTKKCARKNSRRRVYKSHYFLFLSAFSSSSISSPRASAVGKEIFCEIGGKNRDCWLLLEGGKIRWGEGKYYSVLPLPPLQRPPSPSGPAKIYVGRSVQVYGCGL